MIESSDKTMEIIPFDRNRASSRTRIILDLLDDKILRITEIEKLVQAKPGSIGRTVRRLEKKGKIVAIQSKNEFHVHFTSSNYADQLRLKHKKEKMTE